MAGTWIVLAKFCHFSLVIGFYPLGGTFCDLLNIHFIITWTNLIVFDSSVDEL